MAEEQFTSRRARREAERQAAERAFEAREVPEQPEQAPSSRADLLNPPPAKKPDSAPEPRPRNAASGDAGPAGGDDTTSRIDPNPSPHTSHERGALASDHPQESRPPVNAEDRLDPQRAPLPHFESRAEKKRYLREHGLSLNGDLSTGALPVVADEKELAERQAASEGRLTGPLPEVAEADEDQPTDDGSAEGAAAKSPSAPTGAPEPAAEHESYDAAGFGGDTEEVAARDFEAPVTADSAPRPSARENEPFDALSMPLSSLDEDSSDEAATTFDAKTSDADTDAAQPSGGTAAVGSAAAPDSQGEAEGDAGSKGDAGSEGDGATADADSEPAARARRMPIVQPPSTSGVRVVTAASAQIPTTDETGSRPAPTGQSDAAGSAPAPADGADDVETHAPADESGSDDAARALAANPETRPMDAVPEAWALPNSDYEDEETENPPGTRIRASSVTGHDGQILMGEEPSKMPYIVLGIAAFFALALIVVAFIMFQ